MTETRLSFTDHNRPFFGLETVYPVVSRRAGGVSVGINLNQNNACNWACEYCQVPGLVRGKAAPTDLNQLERELNFLLDAVTQETFLETYVPVELRHLKDIAFSGNGEPTSSDQSSGDRGLQPHVVATPDFSGARATPAPAAGHSCWKYCKRAGALHGTAACGNTIGFAGARHGARHALARHRHRDFPADPVGAPAVGKARTLKRDTAD